MGEVYRARDPRLARDVAIKVLPASISDDPDRLRRFEQEARAAGMLNHPNITAVYDFGSHDGAPYVVQELLEGETLRMALAAGRLPQRRAVENAIEIARGLAAAHEKGIVHRDLKPENIFVTSDGRIKILDFGLAKLTQTEAAGGATNVPTVTPGTEPGVVLGTLGYMSPEQVRGKPADHRSDIFALGAILYEMLSGKRAFHGDSAADTMSAIIKEDPPDLSVTGQPISPGLDRIIRHCLEKSPERRLRSAHDLAFELESFSTASGATAAPGLTRRPVPWLRAALVAAALLAVAATAFFAGRRGLSSAKAGKASAITTYSRLTSLGGSELSPSLSPDGKELAFVRQSATKLEIWSQRAGGRKPTSLTADCDKDSYAPAFSPDGNLIAYGSACGGGGIFLMGATGENVRKLASAGNDPAWTPDGKSLVYTTEIGWSPYGRSITSELWAVDVSTGATRRLFTGDAVQASVSPHGLRVAYWGLPYHGSQRDIWTVPLKGLAAGEKPVPVTSDTAIDWNPVWSPDGKSLWFLSNRSGSMNLWRVPIDERTGRTLGPPEPQTLPAADVGGFSLSRDGRRLAYVVVDQTFSVVRAAFDRAAGRLSGAPVELLQNSQRISNPVLSSDGQWIAFDTLGGAQEDLFLMHPDGSGLRQVTDDAPRDRLPSFSPDSQRLVFMSDRSGQWELWTIRLDGSGLSRLSPTLESVFTPLWSPDGKTIAASTGQNVLLLELDEKGAVRATTKVPRPSDDLSVLGLGWTPDGRLLTSLNRAGFAVEKLAIYSPGTHKWEPAPALPHLSGTSGALPVTAVGDYMLAVDSDGLYGSTLSSTSARLLLPNPRTGIYTSVMASPGGDTLYLLQVHHNADIWQAVLP
jgi:Tol biopolymer transport system component